MTNSAPPVGSSGRGSIARDTRLILDSNEYIFGIPGDKASCNQLMERLDKLCVYVPAMVVKEVRDNFQREYRLGKEFFRLIVQGESVTIMWTDPPVDLVTKYIALDFAGEFMKNSLVNLTYEIELGPGEELTLPASLIAQVGAGRWLITIQPLAAPIRSHSAFLSSYAPEDEGLYDDYPPR